MEVGAIFALYVSTFLFLLSTYYFVGSDTLKRIARGSPGWNSVLLWLAGIAAILDLVAAVFVVADNVAGGDYYLVFGNVFCPICTCSSEC